MKPKKSYGQHFLTSEPIAERIAKSLILPNNCKHVLEIGPGMGMLTKYLIDEPYNLKVVEADRDMVSFLRKNYPVLDSKIIESDVLKLKLEEHFQGQFCVIGNFPYNISSQILFKIIDYRDQIPEMVGMFQKEVGERVASPPGSKVYGVISVLIQAYYHTEILFDVDRFSFKPPPKVQSNIIRLTRKSNQVLGCEPGLFKAIVKTTFGQRRKMLRNTLKQFTKSADFLENPDFKRRPEELSVAEFIDLTTKISQLQEK